MRARVDATRERIPSVYPSSYGHFFDEAGKFRPFPIRAASDCKFYPSVLIDAYKELGLRREGLKIPLLKRIDELIWGYTFCFSRWPFRISGFSFAPSSGKTNPSIS